MQLEFSEAIFIRIEPKFGVLDLGSWNLPIVKSANVQPSKTLIIDLTKSEEQLLAEMHPKTRYNIRLAQKHGAEIKDEFSVSAGHGLYYQEAVSLLVKTAKRQGYRGHGADYYHKMIDELAIKNRGEVILHVYKALYHNQLLCSAIMMDFGKTRTFLFGGSAEEHKNVMAPYLMHFRAIQDAKAQGLQWYDFWGVETAGGEMPGFVRFKLGFGGTEAVYAGAYDAVNSQFWYRIYALLRGISKTIKKILR